MPVFVQAMKESWRGVFYWGLALLLVMTLYVSFYGSIGGSAPMQDVIGQLPDGAVAAMGIGDIGSGAGWAHSTFFGLLGLFLLAAASISWGARAIAGDEEGGMLELTLAHRVSRSRLYLERTLGIVLRLAVLGAAVGLTLLVLDGSAGLDLDWANIPPQIIAYVGIGVVCAMATLAVGASTGNRTLATAVGAGVIAAAFLLNALSNVDESNAWMAAISPVSWAYEDRPLSNGWDLVGLALLYGTAAVLGAIGWAVFTRRDIRS